MSHRASSGVSNLFNALQRRRSIEAAVQSVRVEALESRTLFAYSLGNIDDPLFSSEWHLSNTGQFAVQSDGSLGQTGTPGADIDALRAYQALVKSPYFDPTKEIVIAVIDTGLDLTHPDIAANLYTNPGEIPSNGIDDDGNGFIDDVHGWDFLDGDNDVTDNIVGHGTHVAGIAAAVSGNGVGVAGVLPPILDSNNNPVPINVKILPIKIGGHDNTVSFAAAIEGIKYITALKDSGAANVVVANGSFGGSAFPFDKQFSDALERAGESDILFTFSAGNSSLNGDRNQLFPANFSLNLANVITVAATDNQDKLASFSNTGFASVNVAAPGVAITSTWPEALDNNTLTDNLPDGYESISGTSMASPLVAGIIALEKAAFPNATAAQLKSALLSGVDALPNLGSNFSLLPRVSTGGRVNAFRSILNLVNPFVGTDTVTRGDWQGVYGAAGAVVVGDAETFPGFVSASTPGATPLVIDDSSSKTAALRKASDPNDHIISHYAAPQSFDLDLNFNDSQPHRVTLYFADIQNRHRSQLVQIIDAESGEQLDVQTISKFKKGVYLSWDLTSSVVIRITRLAGHDAILNGVFFDSTPINSGTLVKQDDSTSGDWKGHYGSQGAYVVGQSTLFPSFVQGAFSGNVGGGVLKDSTSNSRALEKVGSTDGIVGYLATTTSLTIDLNITDNNAHQLAIYAVDFDKRDRHQRVELLDGNTGEVLSRTDLSDFKNGTYLAWNISGHVQVKLTNLGGRDAVISGLFFDGAAGTQGHLVGLDSTTRGSWVGTYGNESAYVIGDVVGSPNDVNLKTDITFDPSTFFDFVTGGLTNKSALQKVTDHTDRVVAYEASQSAVTIDLNFKIPFTDTPDPTPHRVSFYAVDFDRRKRSERFDVIDADTGAVLSSVELNDFSKGKYITFDLTGHVKIRITRIAGPSAVLSGIFFD